MRHINIDQPYSQETLSNHLNKQLATVLFFIRLFSAVGFAVLYSSLSIFLIEHVDLPDASAISMVGMFIALNYSLALLTSKISGKWISYIQSLTLGIALQIIAYFFIFYNPDYILWGCALFLTGSLCDSIAINMLITERYEQHDNTQEQIFMWNYAGMNLGYFIGFSLVGYLQLTGEYNTASWLIMGLMFIAFCLSIIFTKKLPDIHSIYARTDNRYHYLNLVKTILVLTVIFVFIRFILLQSSLLGLLGTFVLTTVFIWLLIKNYRITANKKFSVVFAVLLLAYLLFWSLYFLIPTGLTVFVRYHTTSEFLGFPITPAWLQNINSFLVIIGAPTLALFFKWLDKHYPWSPLHKFSLGLFYVSLALFLLVIGILFSGSNETISIGWVILTYILITLGELFIAPVGFSVVSLYVERKLQSVMMGVWMAALGLGGLLSSQLTNLVPMPDSQATNTNEHYLKLFVCLSVAAMILSALLYLFTRSYYLKSECNVV